MLLIVLFVFLYIWREEDIYRETEITVLTEIEIIS